MTIQRYAIIDGSGNVVNVVDYDNDPNSPTWSGPWAPPQGQTMMLDPVGASPGWTAPGGVLTPPPAAAPPPPVTPQPDPVSQFLVALGQKAGVPVPASIQAAANPQPVGATGVTGAAASAVAP